MVNRVFLLGRLGKDPEVRQTPSGQSVCSFSLATTKTWTSNGEKKSKTAWHQVSAWSKLGDLCAQYLRKGAEAFIEGEIEYQEWTDKDGVKKYRTQIVAQSVRFIGGKQEQDVGSESFGEHENPWA
jgi:single-strand DNA-binding protein